VTQSIVGTAMQVIQTISSTGPQSTTFSLGFGPAMVPEESLLIQGISLDPLVNATLLGFTGYQNAGLFEVQASYRVLGASTGNSLPTSVRQRCYFGTYNFSA
jgi:hypothetical protein